MKMRVVQANGSGNDPRPNFGLGDATVVREVRVEWPSGNVTVLTNLSADRIVPITEVVNIEPARPVSVVGGSVTLTHTVAATSRQWYSEEGPLVGETGPQLVLTQLQIAQAGRYTVVARTDAGSQTNHVYVRVLTPSLVVTRAAEGIRLECRGDPDTRYTLQGSANLRVWVRAQTLTTDAAGVATATVPIEAGLRFFRVVKE